MRLTLKCPQKGGFVYRTALGKVCSYPADTSALRKRLLHLKVLLDSPLVPAPEPDLGPSWHMDPDPALFTCADRAGQGVMQFFFFFLFFSASSGHNIYMVKYLGDSHSMNIRATVGIPILFTVLASDTAAPSSGREVNKSRRDNS